jgi:arylsulfatase A-like enzyme
MPLVSTAAPENREPPRSLLGLALWAGLVTGFGELAVSWVDRLQTEYVLRSRDAVWMVPAFDAALFGIVGILLIVVARVVHLSWRIAAGFFGGLGLLLVLLLFPRLHPVASVIVALGAGVQIARLLTDRAGGAARVVRRTLPWLVLSVGIVAAVTLGWRTLGERRLASSRPTAGRDAANVLLLILDTVRSGNLSLYGYARSTTPELEHFAQEGTVFNHAFSPASWTTPSHASIFTGRPVLDLGVSWDRALDSRWPTLAEMLRARGYATAGFVANQSYAGWDSGLGRGFEHYDDYPVSLWVATSGTAFGRVLYPTIREWVAPMTAGVPLLWRLYLPHPFERRSAERMNHTFLEWYDRTRPAPFFAFINYMDAHEPYTPPDSFRTRFSAPKSRPVSAEAWTESPELPLTPTDVAPRQARYDGSIAYLDSQLGHLFRELDRRGLLDNTLIIVTSDHGEEFAEHGLVSHGNSLYRLSLHVPLVIRFRGHVPAGHRVTAPVSLQHLAATVLDLVGPDPKTQLSGRSLARHWSGVDTAGDTVIASIARVPQQPAWYPASRGDLNSIAFDGWRYIRTEGPGTEELYDFKHDVLERFNLIGSPEADRLLPLYRAALTSLMRAGPVPQLAEQQ